MFALLMLFLCVILHTLWSTKSLLLLHLVRWHVVLVCHQYDVCKKYVGSVYIGVYGGQSESGHCVFRVQSAFL